MPAKNQIKMYIEGGYYHVYNRGVNKQEIFFDDQDYRVFLHILKTLLLPAPGTISHPLTEITGFTPVRLRELTTMHGEIELLTFCLMPNHFHLLIWQKPKEAMQQFMRRLMTAYVLYVNKKYNRVGHLFQGIYKAALIETDNYLLHSTRYIHQNPSELIGIKHLKEYPYSSYAYYLGNKSAEWVHTKPILAYFKTAQNSKLHDIFSYQSFVEDYLEDPGDILGSLTID